MMTSEMMCQRLIEQGATHGSLLFVSYHAGRTPTPRAIREARRSGSRGIARHHFTGRLESVRVTKNGDPVLTIRTDVRDDERRGTVDDAYRTFNPRVGTLLSLEVID